MSPMPTTDRRKKILIVTSTFPAADNDPVPAFVKDQALWLKRLHPELAVTVLAPHDAFGATKDHTQHHDIDEFRFHYSWPRRTERLAGRGILPALSQNPWTYLLIPTFVLGELLSLFRLVRRWRPDLIYAHWFTPQAITAAIVGSLTGTPFVFTTHASDVAVLERIPGSRWLVRTVCARASGYTAVSERTAAKLERFFTKQQWHEMFEPKLSVIPMGIDIDNAAVSESTVADVKERHGLGDGSTTVLFLGRLTEKKGVSYLLAALDHLAEEQRSRVTVVIAGDGELRPRLMAAAGRSEGVTVFPGYVHGEEKAALLQAADLVCIPSIVDDRGDSEGLPVVLMEALAAGKIVCASDASGAESVLRHGRDGFVFEQRSVPAIAAALSTAIELDADSRGAMEERARLLAKRFAWPKVAEEHYDVFRKVIVEDSSRQ